MLYKKKIKANAKTKQEQQQQQQAKQTFLTENLTPKIKSLVFLNTTSTVLLLLNESETINRTCYLSHKTKPICITEKSLCVIFSK